jgi:UDP-hydrolysing UDP-N-acetyl-D-glucosamine 2-epimerase
LKPRKICIVTTSRADFGLLSGLATSIQRDPELRLQIVASGMHLSDKFGKTFHDIEFEGFKIDRKIPMRLDGKSPAANLRSISVGINGFSKALTDLSPEIMVLLGDRFELLSPAISALMLGIPIAHIHGGELSEGAVDDSVRHAITKMASFHFSATEIYRRRIIQLGEEPRRVFNFGAPGLDRLHNSSPISRSQLELEFGINFDHPVALVTYHPPTRDRKDTKTQVGSLVGAIKLARLTAIVTMANADAEGALINRLLQSACRQSPHVLKWVPHLGHLRYLSCMNHAALMIGNSSSGITEAPSFRLPVVNIGDRQRGRVKARNIIDVSCEQNAILRGIRRAVSPNFRVALRRLQNPYDRFRDGRTAERIKDVLKNATISSDLLKKHFYDLNEMKD